MDTMPRPASRPRATVADLLRVPRGTCAELIDGELYVTPSPSWAHQRLLGKLYTALDTYATASGAGEVAFAPIDVYLPSGDVVQPDIVFVASDQRNIIEQIIRGTPRLLIEVVSPGNPERDRFVKRRLYAENCVPEYWIVDPLGPDIEVLRLDGERYVSHAWYRAGGTFVSPTLPGFSLPIERLTR